MALKISAQRLATEFPTIFSAATMESFLRSSYDQFGDIATTSQLPPLLGERFTRQRLQALARIAGPVTDGKPVVLFICLHDVDRSQMALGFFTEYAAGRAITWSGGSEPGTAISEVAVAAMAEKSIDIPGQFPKPWTREVVQAADVVVTLGGRDTCPIFLDAWYQEWAADDPAQQDIDAVRSIRDHIERRVVYLLAEIGVPATAQR